MKKHVVLILSDQHNAKVLGSAGNPFVRTPHLDRLAESGATFSNCYCPSPLCVPSRASIMAGLLPSRTGVFTNEQSLHSDIPTFAHALALAGYETTLCGRMHFVGLDQRHGFMNRLVGDICPTQLGVGGGGSYGILGNTSGATRVAVEKSGHGHSNVLEYDQDVTRAACDYLDELDADNGPDQFLTVGLYKPHCPFVARKDLYDHYYDQLPDPDEGPWDLHPYTREFNERCNLGGFKPEELKRVQAAYYAMVEELDEQIGVLLSKIDKTLGLDNTLVIYASDHGEMMGEKGLICKTHFYDSSARVPLICSSPNWIPPQSQIDSPTSLLDLAPTLIEFAEAPKLPQTDGESLIPLLKGEDSSPDRAVVSQFATTVDGYVSGMVRKGDWKYIYYHGYEHPQLFNMVDDPDELHDLGADRRYTDLCREMKAVLDRDWDPDKISEHVKRNWEASKLISQFNRTTGVQPFEVWHCPEEKNYLG